jgi:hypothetical protein
VRGAGCCILTALRAVVQVLGNIFGTKNTSEMETKATLDHLSQITQVANSRGGTPSTASERERGRWPSSDLPGMRCKRYKDG